MQQSEKKKEIIILLNKSQSFNHISCHQFLDQFYNLKTFSQKFILDCSDSFIFSFE